MLISPLIIVSKARISTYICDLTIMLYCMSLSYLHLSFKDTHNISKSNSISLQPQMSVKCIQCNTSIMLQVAFLPVIHVLLRCSPSKTFCRTGRSRCTAFYKLRGAKFSKITATEGYFALYLSALAFLSILSCLP